MKLSHVNIILLFSTSVVCAIVDDNANGISDVWERKYQMSDTSPFEDPDGDGQNNLLESIAGTDPNDASSVLGIEDIDHKPNSVLVSWKSSRGQIYQLQRSSNLLESSWLNEGDPIIGTGGAIIAAADQTSHAHCFYRVTAISGHSSLLQNAVASLAHDTDFDGQSDIAEIRLGYDPFDNQSNWQTPTIDFGSNLRVSWNSVKGKVYRLESRATASGSEWEFDGDPYLGTGGVISAISVRPDSAQRYYSVRVEDVDTDGDGLSDWEEHQVGFNSKREKTDSLGQGDWLEMQAKLSEISTIKIEARATVANITRMEGGAYELSRKGGLDALNVNYTVSGTAIAGSDYVSLSGSVTIPFGVNSVIIPVTPIASSSMSLTESVIVTLNNSTDYDLDDQNIQQINVIKEVALDVMSYGAVGDGITDDTAAIQAALDALETSTTHNTLHFPQGIYRLNTTEWDANTVTANYRILSFGETDLAGRDVIFRGETGSKLYSTVSPIRAHMLMVFASFRSLHCYGMSWEKDSVPLSEKPAGVEPSGADGIALVAPDLRIVEQIKLQGCKFTNCHGAMMMTANGFDRRGHLRRLEFYDCELRNPYGSNTINSRAAYGGGQQIYLSPWVKTAYFKRNFFEGGGVDLTDQTTSPGGRLKDAAVFGSPLQMVFTDNTVLRMGVEAVVHAGAENWMTQLEADTVIPAADGISKATVQVADFPSTFTAGQSILLIKPTTPTSAPVVNVLRVDAYDVQTRMLTYANDGVAGNAPPGTTIPRFSSVNYNNQASNPKSLLTANVLDGTFPPGADTSSYSIGFMVKTNALIKDNFIKNFVVGIMSYDAKIPYPGGMGLTIDSNIIITANYTAHFSQIIGMRSWAPDQYILNNIIMIPASTRTLGISLEGDVSYVAGNHIIAMKVERHSYTSYFRSVGIGVGNPSSGVVAVGNYTYGLDVGVGPENPNQIIPHQVINHYSVNDVLPVDHRGLVE